MSDIKFACPQCQQHIQCEEAYGGLEIACPTCSTKIIVPRPVSAPAIAPAPAVAPPPVPAPAPALARSSAPGAAAGGCPSCGNPMPRGAVLCTNCGYNMVTRQRTGAGRKAAPGRPKAARPEGVGAWFKTIYPYLAIIVVLMGVLLVLSKSNPTLKMAYIGGALIFYACVRIWLLVVAFKDSILKGILCLCINIYALYYVFKENEDYQLKAAYGVALLILLGIFLLGDLPQ